MNEGMEDPPPIIAKDGHVVPHGTGTAYTRWHCRCTRCRENNATKASEYRQRKANREGRQIRPIVKGDPPHGSRSRYTSVKLRCRCDECSQANRDYQAERQRLIRAGIKMTPEWETW